MGEAVSRVAAQAAFDVLAEEVGLLNDQSMDIVLGSVGHWPIALLGSQANGNGVVLIADSLFPPRFHLPSEAEHAQLQHDGLLAYLQRF